MLIQLCGFGVNFMVVNKAPAGSLLSDIGFWCLIASFPIALVVDIVLALRWGKDWKQKLIYIFLMPTNYMGPILVVWFFWYASWIYGQIFGL